MNILKFACFFKGKKSFWGFTDIPQSLLRGSIFRSPEDPWATQCLATLWQSLGLRSSYLEESQGSALSYGKGVL